MAAAAAAAAGGSDATTDPAPLTLFLRPPLVMDVMGLTDARVLLDTLLPEPRFIVDGIENLGLEAAMRAIASRRAYATRRSAETVLACLYVVLPVTPTSTYFLPWREFVTHATAVTQTRIVLEMPRKRGRTESFAREVPPAFAGPAPPPVPRAPRAPRRRTTL
ncbi:MAG: hypothetical protein CMH53_00080, partial [Myxococcales bacterium]|nr:hypothetical protein [Myxococcales bacterium]